jgi:hypothetical protein
MSRQDQYNITVSATRHIDGSDETRNLGTFDKMSGGNADSEESKYSPGNMAEPITLGGRRTIENVTVERLYDLQRDASPVSGGQSNLRWLMNGVGSAQIVVTKQSLDVNKNPFGYPLVYRGTLKAVTPPEVDSESTDAATWSIEITTYGNVG